MAEGRVPCTRCRFFHLALLVSVVASLASGAKAQTTRTEGLAAWQQVYSVLTHPRCINCHTATNYPQQGDDRHPHFQRRARSTALAFQHSHAPLVTRRRMPTAPVSQARRAGTWRRSQ